MYPGSGAPCWWKGSTPSRTTLQIMSSSWNIQTSRQEVQCKVVNVPHLCRRVVLIILGTKVFPTPAPLDIIMDLAAHSHPFLEVRQPYNALCAHHAIQRILPNIKLILTIMSEINNTCLSWSSFPLLKLKKVTGRQRRGKKIARKSQKMKLKNLEIFQPQPQLFVRSPILIL